MRKSLIVLIAGVALFLAGCGAQKAAVVEVTPTPTPDVKMLKEGDKPKVDLTLINNNHAVKLSITDITSDIKRIEYSIVYDTNGMQRGIVGSKDLKAGQDTFEEKQDLGSCSKNICVYDKNIKSLQLTVKFTTDSIPLEFQKEYPL